MEATRGLFLSIGKLFFVQYNLFHELYGLIKNAILYLFEKYKCAEIMKEFEKGINSFPTDP